MTTIEQQLKDRLDITKDDDGSLYVRGSLYISDDTSEQLPVSLSRVDGDLSLCSLPNLKDLSNTPTIVGGIYHLLDCPLITSWVGNRVVSCENLNFWMETGITTFTGGPLYVACQIDAKPDMDFYDLPLGDWYCISFGEGYEQRSKEHLLALMHEFKDVTVTDLPKHLDGSSSDPLRSWIIGRIMQELKPFRNY
jgi:hypothetical protein